MTRNTDPMLDCVASEETTSPGKLCSRCRELPFGKLQKLRHPPPSLPLHPALYLSDLSSLVDLRFGVRVTALRSQYTRQPTYVSSLHTYPDESSRIACVYVCMWRNQGNEETRFRTILFPVSLCSGTTRRIKNSATRARRRNDLSRTGATFEAAKLVLTNKRRTCSLYIDK